MGYVQYFVNHLFGKRWDCFKGLVVPTSSSFQEDLERGFSVLNKIQQRKRIFMNILILNSDYYGNIGGKSTHIDMLVKGLREKGNNVELFVLVDNLKKYDRLIISGVGRVFDLFRLGIFMRSCLIKKRMKNKLKQYLHDKKFNLIHAHDPLAALACLRMKKDIPLVLTVHGELTNEFKSQGFIQSRWEEKHLCKIEESSYTNSDMIIAVDTRIRNYILNSYNVAQDKVIKMFNFLDVNSFKNKIGAISKEDVLSDLQLPKDKDFILIPRRLVKKSGVIYGIMALAYLKKKYNIVDKTALVVGSGPEYMNIKQYVCEQKLENEIIIVNEVPHRKMYKYYKAAFVTLIPSINIANYKEATSLSALESMAAGVPVIASDIGGLSEIIKNKDSGILVAEKSPDEIADAIFEIINDHPLRKKIIQNAFNYVLNNHDYKQAVEKVFLIYKKAVNLHAKQ